MFVIDVFSIFIFYYMLLMMMIIIIIIIHTTEQCLYSSTTIIILIIIINTTTTVFVSFHSFFFSFWVAFCYCDPHQHRYQQHSNEDDDFIHSHLCSSIHISSNNNWWIDNEWFGVCVCVCVFIMLMWRWSWSHNYAQSLRVAEIQHR